ncbi:hypothetical protein B0H65DRAFT_267144 [Neurospora tetraspora]|uniref:Uncharacterized protein n=1 Tax=Neurospora tetraspora TaxID=94610 RepID=A0AAE0JB76_9PEZI|nr:hypothetical protein B0H65DRAFT_267144 [Neurospora tetraspora]
MHACSPVISFACLFGASCGEYRTNGRFNHLTFLPDKENRHLSPWTTSPCRTNSRGFSVRNFAFFCSKDRGDAKTPVTIEDTQKDTTCTPGFLHFSAFPCSVLISVPCPLQLFAMGFEVLERCRINRPRSLAQHQKSRTPFLSSHSPGFNEDFCGSSVSMPGFLILDKQRPLDSSTTSEHVLSS